jgi:hypothetical protein
MAYLGLPSSSKLPKHNSYATSLKLLSDNNDNNPQMFMVSRKRGWMTHLTSPTYKGSRRPFCNLASMIQLMKDIAAICPDL